MENENPLAGGERALVSIGPDGDPDSTLDAAVARLASWPEVRRAKAMLVMSHQINAAKDAIRAIAQAAVDALDQIEGDPDFEAEPVESNGDEQDAAWIEWTTLHGRHKGSHNLTAGHEDDEEDDPPGLCDEDGINTHDQWLQMGHFGPGCVISDSDHGIDDVRHDPDQDGI